MKLHKLIYRAMRTILDLNTRVYGLGATLEVLNDLKAESRVSAALTSYVKQEIS